MKDAVRRALEMAARVRVFSRTNPFSDADSALVLTLFESRAQRAEALEEQERAGKVSSQAANKRRAELKDLVRLRLLRHLSRVGGLAGKDTPEVAERFKVPSGRLNNQAFHAVARGMLAQAEASKDQLGKVGLTERILAELTKSVDEYERATETAQSSRLSHIGARAELAAVARDLVELVGVLDGLNQLRFRDNPELLAGWQSARNVVARFRKAKEVPVEGSSDGPNPGNGAVSAA